MSNFGVWTKKVKYRASIFLPVMRKRTITLIFIFLLTVISILAAGVIAEDTEGDREDADVEPMDNFIAGIILTGVFLIIGGIATAIVRRDISRRNMNMKRWILLLILFITIIPSMETFLILVYGVNSFYGFISLASSFLIYIALYTYFRSKSVLLVENVPTEFTVKLSPAHREILAFGIFIFGLLIMIIGIYQIGTGHLDVGNPVFFIGLAATVIGLILVGAWFSYDNLTISRREVRIKRGKEIVTLAWKDIESIIFFKELSHLLNIDFAGYHKRMAPSGSQRAVEIIAKEKRLKFQDGEIPSYEDFRILFFILLHHRRTSNPEAKVYFHSKWAKAWYRDYRRHIMKNS